jgi:hypothetical protein
MKRLTDGRSGSGPEVAESLEDAKVGSLVYVDQRGQVRPFSQFRTQNALRTAGFLGVLGACTWVFWGVGGPVGLAVGGGFGLLYAAQVAMGRRIGRAMALIVDQRLDEAEALLAPLASGPFRPVALRSRANHNLARIASLRDRHEDALAFQELALRQVGHERTSRTERRMIEYARVITLVNVGRVGEARDELNAVPLTLEGDYLRAQRAAAELYVAFGEGQHRFDQAYLSEQADIASNLPSARTLLGLLAWAQDHAGRPREASRLILLAVERPGEDLVRHLYPRLAAWMDERGEPAGV